MIFLQLIDCQMSVMLGIGDDGVQCVITMDELVTRNTSMKIDNGARFAKLTSYQYFWFNQFALQLHLAHTAGVKLKQGDWEVTKDSILYKGAVIELYNDYQLHDIPGYDGPVTVRFCWKPDILRFIAVALAMNDSTLY